MDDRGLRDAAGILRSFDYAAAAKLKKEALALMDSKFERESFENQYEEIEKRAREFQKQTKEAAKLQKEGAKANPESLENPFGTGAGTLGE